MSPHADLIPRLEADTGDDRELADDVLMACGWRLNFSPHEIAEVRRDGWKTEGECGEAYVDTFASFMDHACWYAPGAKPFRDKWTHGHYRPNPLASLDAALALAEAKLSLSWVWQVRREGRSHANLWNDNLQVEYYAEAPTAPLAVLIALFRALEARG